MESNDPQILPTCFGFLLLEDFTLISVSSAIETLRMANRVAESQVYRWRMISESGAPVSASDGLSISVDFAIGDDVRVGELDAVVVCGGERIERHCEKPVMHWLRACSARGLALVLPSHVAKGRQGDARHHSGASPRHHRLFSYRIAGRHWPECRIAPRHYRTPPPPRSVGGGSDGARDVLRAVAAVAVGAHRTSAA